MVDLGLESHVRLYDDALLFGRKEQGRGENPPDACDIARMTNTIPYEVTLLVSRRVPRVYII